MVRFEFGGWVTCASYDSGDVEREDIFSFFFFSFLKFIS